MPRILLLMDGIRYSDLSAALQSAWKNAESREELSFGLSLVEEPDALEDEDMGALGNVLFLTDGLDKWACMPKLWQGEPMVLAAEAGQRFLPGWDRVLLRTWQQLHKKDEHAEALTGMPPFAAQQVFAMHSIAVSEIDGNRQCHFQRGASLRYAETPVAGNFLNPDFCFAPSAFFRKMADVPLGDFLSVEKPNALYSLHIPVCTVVSTRPLPEVSLQDLDEDQLLSCRRMGLQVEQREVKPMARIGLGMPDLKIPLSYPRATRVRNYLRSPGRHAPTPLCVTTFVSPNGTELPADQIRCFHHLTAIRDVPVLCYADPAVARQAMQVHTNVLAYKKEYMLRVDRNIGLVRAANSARLCHPFLLSQSRERFMTNSHYVWIDFDYLSYPVYPSEYVDWAMLCTNKIVMASVDGVPDCSMIVVPEQMLQLLCREITSLCDDKVRRFHALPEAADMWRQLNREHPDWFDLLELPGERELFGMMLESVQSDWPLITEDEP